MFRSTFVRLLLAAALAVASGVDGAHAQLTNDPGPRLPDPVPAPLPPRHKHNNVVWYITGGTVAAILGWVIGTRVFNSPGAGDPPPRNSFPDYTPPLEQVSLPPTGGGITPPAPRAPGGNGPGGTTVTLRNGFNLPPPGETRFATDKVMLDIPSSVPTRILDLIAANHNMTRLATKTFRLTGRTLHVWQINGGTRVPDMIINMAGDQQVAGAQPLYLFRLAQDSAEPVNSDQYAPEKLNLLEAHRLATGNRVLVAVIDSGVDTSHPDLAGVVKDSLNAAGDDPTPHAHGTGMAGAIAAHRTMLGTAPRVGLLTVRAFGSKPGTAEGTTFNIIQGLDWAAEKGARVINMSFAGPPDPRLRDALAKASKKGIVLIAAAGNAGPKSPPLYPGADPNVIAVTATDVDDGLFPGANRGSYIAVAAPGVDVLVPNTGGTYQLTTGTSVASAEVSGIAALLIERNPSLKPADVRRILMRTAKAVAPKGRERDYGAGLVNALGAVTAAKGAPVAAAKNASTTAAKK